MKCSVSPEEHGVHIIMARANWSPHWNHGKNPKIHLNSQIRPKKLPPSKVGTKGGYFRGSHSKGVTNVMPTWWNHAMKCWWRKETPPWRNHDFSKLANEEPEFLIIRKPNAPNEELELSPTLPGGKFPFVNLAPPSVLKKKLPRALWHDQHSTYALKNSSTSSSKLACPYMVQVSSQTYRRIYLQKIFSDFACSQIWLHIPVNHHHFGYNTNLPKENT